jgi:hypothetical protein
MTNDAEPIASEPIGPFFSNYGSRDGLILRGDAPVMGVLDAVGRVVGIAWLAESIPSRRGPAQLFRLEVRFPPGFKDSVHVNAYPGEPGKVVDGEVKSHLANPGPGPSPRSTRLPPTPSQRPRTGPWASNSDNEFYDMLGRHQPIAAGKLIKAILA